MKNIADFVVFSDDYGRHPSSCQHLIRRFLPENRVLWVNTIGLRRPTFSTYDFWRSIGKIKEWTHPLRHLEKNLWVYSPFSIPWNKSSFIRRRNRRLGVAGVRKVIRKLGFQKIVSLATVPNVGDWIGEFGEKLMVYYCVDDFSEWPGMERKTILEMERLLLQKTDLFVPVSEKLRDMKKTGTATVLYLPHGVDVDHFKKAFRHPAKSAAPPVVGYFGLIDDRLDFDLLLELAEKRPSFEWRFLGPLQYCPTELRRMKNCRFLPPVPYGILPETLRDWDVLLLPYKSVPVVEALNPLKLREAIATGKPVVSRDMPWGKPYRDVVSLCSTPEQFLEALDSAVLRGNGVKAKNQWEKVKPESWETRAETLFSAIENELQSKK